MLHKQTTEDLPVILPVKTLRDYGLLLGKLEDNAVHKNIMVFYLDNFFSLTVRILGLNWWGSTSRYTRAVMRALPMEGLSVHLKWPCANGKQLFSVIS